MEAVREWLMKLRDLLSRELGEIRREVAQQSLVVTRRLHSYLGTEIAAADVAISSGWGNTPTPTATVTGNDQRGTISFTSGSVGLTANPTVVLTYKDGAWPIVPFAYVLRNDTASPVEITWSTTATALTITLAGTPVASTVYTFDYAILG